MQGSEGPHAVSIGKECKRAMISKSGGRQGAAERGTVHGRSCIGGCLWDALRPGDSMWYCCWGPGPRKLEPDRP